MERTQTRRIRIRGRELALGGRARVRRPCRPGVERSVEGLRGRFTVAAERLDRHSAALYLGGELDVAAVPALESGLRRIERWAPVSLLVDAADIGFVDLGVVRRLAACHARLSAAGGELLVIHPPDCLLRILEVLDDLELPVLK